MILNEFKLKFLIRESIKSILLEKYQFKTMSIIVNNLRPIKEIALKFYKKLFDDVGLDYKLYMQEIESSQPFKKALSLISSIKDSIESFVKDSDRVYQFVKKTRSHSLMKFGDYLFKNDPNFKKIKSDNEITDPEPIREFASNFANDVVGSLNNEMTYKIIAWFVIFELELAGFSKMFLNLSEQDKKRYSKDNLKGSDIQRSLKQKFVEKNIDSLQNDWKFVHYPYALSGTTLDPLSRVLNFLNRSYGKVSKDELPGVAYPKDFNTLIDTLATGTDKIYSEPNVGVILSGFITAIFKSDIHSTMIGKKDIEVGGPRVHSGFARYPYDKEEIMGNPDIEGKVPLEDTYIKDLEEYKNNFETYINTYGYNEAFIDNWSPVALVCNWPLVVKSLSREQLKSIKERNVVDQILSTGILIKDKNFTDITPDKFRSYFI